MSEENSKINFETGRITE